MDADYLKLEKAWKKIHAAKKKAGKLDSWGLSRVLSPAGANSEYDYVARNSYLGNVQFAASYEEAFMPANWKTLLTPAEVVLVNRTEKIRTVVKEEVWSEVDKAVNDNTKNWTISVVNYFGSPEGKTVADHIKMEQDIWKPLHAARVKDGNMSGWILRQMDLPFGESMPYNMMAVDLYTNMTQYLAPWFDTYFKKVHPGKKIDDLMKQTGDAENLVKGELRMKVDQLDQ